MDGLLDLRFDIIWLVTYFDEETRSQSLLHYYDFEEGTDIVADGNLTVEVLDRDDVLITTLSGLLRDDGWYEAYWDTTTTTKSTYNIKVTAEINSKTYVMEELVSVQWRIF